MSMKTYTTSMSNTVGMLASATLAIGVVAIAIVTMRVSATPIAAYLGMVMLLILAIAFVVSTKSYEIGDGKLVIHQQVGSKTYELRGASVVQDAQAFRGLVRIFGNGGFFAFDGLYYSSRLGLVRSYARNRSHGVVVHLAGGRKLVLSPDQPEAFVAAAVAQGAVVSSP
jgi:hypothetical protein